MANHKSAEKRARQALKRNEKNRACRSRIRTLTKEAEAAVASGRPDAKTALRKAESALAKSAASGTLHKRTAARKISRLAKRTKKAQKA